MLEMSDKLKKDLKMIGSGLIAYIIVVIIDHSGLLAHVPHRLLLTFLLYLIPYIIVGGEVVKKAFIGIKNKQMFDESFLMAVATFGAFATGENAEAVAVMLFYQVGEWFQSYAVGKSRKNISDLMDIEPEYANIERDGKVEECDPYDVEVGDTLVIKPGERVPVDGEVIEGSSLVNTSALTGESVPRSVKQGDEIIICGKLVNYKGNTPETVANQSYIYSLNGNTGGGGSTPTPGNNHGTAEAPLTGSAYAFF